MLLASPASDEPTAVAATGDSHGTSTSASTPMRKLSAQQLAGQRVLYSDRALTPPASLRARIRAGAAAGVIFFADNVSSRTQIAGVIAQLQRAAAQRPVEAPLLMMTDQEGRLVRRPPGAPLRSEKQIGRSSHPLAAARQAGHDGGPQGRGDQRQPGPRARRVPSAGRFFDRFGRSCSTDLHKVAQLAAAFIAAQQQVGVAATGKHFPWAGERRPGLKTRICAR
jgi:beta-N-acetylhexosaminidase